jgi:DNA polymerase-3 subunit gamma/tau
VKLDDVLEILGVADAELVLDAAEALCDRDPRGALLIVQRVSESGRDVTQFMRDLTAHLRHLFVVQTLHEVPDSFSVTAEHTERLAAQAERLGQGEIVRAIDFLAAAIAAVKEGSDPRIQLEVALLKSTQPQADLSLQALMYRIEELERRLGGVDGGPSGGDEMAAPRRTVTAPESAPRSGAGASRAVGPSAAAAPAVGEPLGAAEPTAAPAHHIERLQALWPAVAEALREREAFVVAALLGEARPIALDGDRLTVRFPEDAVFKKRQAEANRGIVEEAIGALTGRPVTVVYELSGGAAQDEASVLSDEELLARLREDFGATEVFDDDPPSED